jgi:hypothetical protein
VTGKVVKKNKKKTIIFPNSSILKAKYFSTYFPTAWPTRGADSSVNGKCHLQGIMYVSLITVVIVNTLKQFSSSADKRRK